MAGKFQWSKFLEIDLGDSFFDSLKKDYFEFPEWFKRKSYEGESALVFYDERGIGAFIYLKLETEGIALNEAVLPSKKRLKIGTFRLAERFRGVRLGEGALGVSLWKWRDEKAEEIYATVFEKHEDLVNLFERFGFISAGKNCRGECVYLKNRSQIDYSDPYKAFPFIKPNFEKAGLIPIYESFHDKLFPYSELKGKNYEMEEETAGNGITKIYIGTPYTSMQYDVGEPVGIYRIYEGSEGKTYRSAITSYCTITKVEIIKSDGYEKVSLLDFIKRSGNKTIFTKSELEKIYRRDNVIMLELIYNGFFGKGNNVIHKVLKEKGMFNGHPYSISYTKEQFIRILEMGDVNVQNVIID